MSVAGPLTKQLTEIFPAMPPQLQAAARFVLDHPNEVALLSMREQAKRAGVPAATMTRLAQRLGFSGYDDVKAIYADGLRWQSSGFFLQAEELVERHRVRGDAAIGADLIQTMAHEVEMLRSGQMLEKLVEAARLITSARRLLVAGQRSGYVVAFHLAYICGLIGCDSRLLEAAGGIGVDHLAGADAQDVIVAVSVRPYTRETLRLANTAVKQGCRLIAITDSLLSPLAESATTTLVVGIDSPSFFHTMTPAFAVAEALAALAAGIMGDRALARLQEREHHFEAYDVFLMPRPKPRIRK